MQQIIIYIFKNSTKVLFLLLFTLALILTIQNHSYHRSSVINSANKFSGGVYEKVNSVNEYFLLKSENEALARENARLKSLLFNQTDSLIQNTKKKWNDQMYEVSRCKVIQNSYNNFNNILTLNAGKKIGVEPEMGVINHQGIIGVVEKTSDNYATVVSILNTKNQINSKVKHSNHFGIISWNGKNTGYVQITDLPRLATVKKGDTIVTSQSLYFPEGIPIGAIDKIYTDNKTNYYTVDVRLFNDMTNLGYVYVIKNYHKQEIENLQKESILK